MASKLDAALALAERGFKIFPLAPGTKNQPLLAGWPQLATSDPALIAAQWGPSGTPDANIGIHADGMIVVDVDTKKGGDDSLRQLELMYGFPPTFTVRTPTGGRHLYFRAGANVPNSVEGLGRGLDVRSGGGYVVGPGSTISDAHYLVALDTGVAAAPDWLTAKLGYAPVAQRHAIHDQPDAPDDSVERARSWLVTAERSVKGQGGDQTAFRVACRLRDLGLSYQQACDLMRSEAWDYGCGWRDGRLEEKPIRSAYTYAQNEEGGGRGVVEDDLPLPSNPQAGGDVPNLSTIVPKKGTRSRLVRADAFAAEAGRGPGYVVKNLLQRASYVVGYGDPGVGKSFVALDAGYHVANDLPWMGLLVHGGPVLYLAFEGYGGLKNRARALQQKYGKDLGPLYLVNATMNLRELAGRQELGALLAEMPAKPVLVIIDTFARALMGGDENSAQDVGALNDAIAKLIDATGACVLLIHHTGKNKAAGARGSSAIKGAIDTELEFDLGMLRPSKQRDLEIIPPLLYKLRPVVVGIDEDGDEEKSCVIEPGQAGAALGGRPLTGKAEHAFNILSELTGSENNPVPRARWVAKLQDEGFGRSVSHEWVRKLQKFGKVTIDSNQMVTRRLA
jgi:hypothetical protein